MKAAINTQSQNEVKDLLNEYVVSPLNTDISTTLSKMSTEIESLEEITKVNIGKISPSVNGNIRRLQTMLDLSFHFDDKEDVFENLSDTIESSQEIITEQFKALEELIKKLQSASDTSTNEIKSELSNLQTSFSNELSALSAQMKESYEQSEKHSTDIQGSLISKLQEIEALITKNNEGLTENINTKLQTVSDNYTEQSTVICNYHKEAKTAINSMESQQQTFIEQKYKTLFAVSLSFGIINAVGLIAMIVLFLIK